MLAGTHVCASFAITAVGLFMFVGVFYSCRLNIKLRMLLIKKHAADANIPLVKRLRAEIII